MGFGHRVYRVRDPRAAVLSSAADHLYQGRDDDFFETVRAFETVAVDALAARAATAASTPTSSSTPPPCSRASGFRWNCSRRRSRSRESPGGWPTASSSGQTTD